MASDREEIQRRLRHLHEQLRALSGEPLMRGSIVERLRRWGRPHCACARDRKARHGGKLLTVYLDVRTHPAHLRPQAQGRLRPATMAYAPVWDVINSLTA